VSRRIEPRVDNEAIGHAARLLCAGALVAFPTETVYGLGADATDDPAVARIFAAKGRPRFNPLIVHVPDLDAAAALVRLDERARTLAARFWPGPLTLVLPRCTDARVSLLVSAGLDTVAIRAPDHPVAQALLAAAGRPIAAPSANVSGRISPTTAAHVRTELGDRVAAVLDGGPCRVGLESTVLDLSGRVPTLLRPGAISSEILEAMLGRLASPTDAGAPRSPGMLRRHYAPRRPLRLDATAVGPAEALLGFGPETADCTLSLSPRGDLVEAAGNLFAMLRALDAAEGFSSIAVARIPEHELGRAINDRLRRAAAPAEDSTAWNDDRGPAAPCVLPGWEDDDSATG